MKSKMFFKTLMILFCCALLQACGKDEIPCTDEEAFCELVKDKKYDELKPLINNYLAGLTYNLNSEDELGEKLEELERWLQCKSCVGSVKIGCNSCIYTNPAQSELIVRFKTGSGRDKKIMDISMAHPLKMHRFH